MNKYLPKKLSKAFVVSCLLMSVSACSVVDNFVDTKVTRLDYTNNETVKTLDFPPDLTAPEFDTAFALPADGIVSVAAMGNGISPNPDARLNVLPASVGVHSGGSGTIRWLDVDQPAEALWPKIRSFWRSVGISIKRDEPRIGIMETNWSESKAGLPADWLRGVLGSTFKRSYDAGVRDKYQIRVEKSNVKTTRVFLTHRAAEEKTRTGWELRPANHVKEAELINRLKAFLQGDVDAAKGVKKLPASSRLSQTASLASVVEQEGQPILQVHDNYKRAWVLTGVMMDRMGLVTEKRDQAAGIYHVTYQGNDEDVAKRGYFKRLFGGRKTLLLKGGSYQVHVQDSGKLSVVRIMDEDGEPLNKRQTKLVLMRLKQEFDR